MKNAIGYAIVDKNGSLWMDDFDTEVGAKAEMAILNADSEFWGSDIREAQPFSVISIYG